MSSFLGALEHLDFLQIMWFFPVAYALHEAEEWNIMRWYARNYKNLPPATDRTARTWIVFSSVAGFVWFLFAALPASSEIAAWLVLPAIALVIQNALQHIYWLFHFRQYAPGVVTSVMLLVPIGGYLVFGAVQQRYVPVWYVALWGGLMVPGLVQTVRAGNEMTAPVRAIHHWGIRLSKLIFER